MLERITELESRALSDLQAADTPEALEAFRIRYLGTKGELKALMGLMKDVPKEQKRDFGQNANALKQKLQDAFDQKKEGLGTAASPSGPLLDITEPPSPPRRGRQHIITRTVAELVEIFGRMGFDTATGPEVEDEYHNFVALNIPAEHPAREPADNFYLNVPGSDPGRGGPSLLRSQTSTVQIRVMEKTQPPIRIISPGRVYRPDEHDATHYSMFHQIEGLYVDRGVTMVDLKTTLVQFAQAFWGPEADIKLVPSYFPFTEPSAELYVKVDLGKGPTWMEVGGCGMVDPAVFEHVGYDPEQWTGFAFGLGIERLAMRKHNIPDIRLLFENDLRFLRQF